MKTSFLRLTTRDPVIARDGRPFGASQGFRMRTLNWPLPSVIAGSLRTALVKSLPNANFGKDRLSDLIQVKVAGLFPMGKELFLPSPLDCVWQKDPSRIHFVHPNPVERGGCDFPVDGLLPVMLTHAQAADEFKGQDPPAWWPMEKMVQWLSNPTKPMEFDCSFLLHPRIETRDHVAIDPKTGASLESRIFSTSSLNLNALPEFGKEPNSENKKSIPVIDLATRVCVDEKHWNSSIDLNCWHPLGGERRLVHWQSEPSGNLWNCPEKVSEALKVSKKIRLVLATPAIFEQGWRPGWLDPRTLTGRPSPEAPLLKLSGVCNARWKAVSGWSLAEVAGRPKGPKAIQRFVPAGSVYFFEKVNEGNLSKLWLQSVCDQESNQNDGFGLALWGIW